MIMSKIVIAGDAHGRWDTLLRSVKDLEGEVLIQLGDTGFYPFPQRADKKSKQHDLHEKEYLPYLTGKKDLPLPTYFMKGNHEDFDFLKRLESGEIRIPNLTFIPNGSVIEVGGTRFGFLGGNYGPGYIDRKTLQGGKRKHFLQSELDQLAEQEFDVLLTHDGPTSEELRGGCDPIRKLILKTRPKVAYHGHLHHAYETMIGDTKVIGLGKVGSNQRYVTVHDESR